jgi:hypothetical protein
MIQDNKVMKNSRAQIYAGVLLEASQVGFSAHRSKGGCDSVG